MLKIGVLGIAHMHGYSYVNQLKNIKDVEIVGLYEETKAIREKAQVTLDLKIFETPEKLIKECDGLVIASENSKHKDYVLLCAENGKHVLCEKPISTNEADAKEMIEACKKNNVIFQMAFPVRYAPSVQEAKKVIETGALGEVVSVSATNHGRMPGGWFVEKELSGGGSVIDHTVHVVDIIRWLLGVEVKEVSAQYDKLIHDELSCEDCGLIMMRLSNGAFMTLDSSWTRPDNHPYWGDVTIRLNGTKGSLFIDAFDAKIEVYSKTKGNRWDNFGDNFDEELIKEFVRILKTKDKPLTEGNDGLQTLRVALAAYESQKNNTVIKL